MRRELELARAATRLPRAAVERQVGEAQRCCRPRLGRLGAAQQRPQPRLELLQRERLDEVVVGAGVQAGDAIVDGVARGQHQHRRAIAGVAQAPADLEAVDPGHRDVEHDRVVARVGQAIQRLAAVGRELDLIAVQAQRAIQRGPHRGLVVDDQHARHSARLRIGRRR